MTPEEKSLLESTYKMSEENNAILRGIRRSNRWSKFLHLLYWLLIIVITFAAYYALQPYLAEAIKIVNQGQSVLNQIQNTPR